MRRGLLLLCWLITDLALMLGAYVAAYFLRVGLIISTDFPLDKYLQVALCIAPVWLAVMGFLGVYRLTRVQIGRKNLAHILFSCVFALSLFTLAYYFVHNQFFSRLLLIYAVGLHLMLTTVWHAAFDQWQRRILRKDPPSYPVLVIGTNREAERFIARLNEHQSPLKPIGVLDCQGSPKAEISGVPVLGKFNVLEEVIRKYRPTHLVQCSNREHTGNLMSVCRQHNMRYMLLPSVLGTVGGSENVDIIEGQPVIVVDN